MQNSQDICMSLLRAESADEVKAVIANTPEMADDANWHYVGDTQNNQGTFTNQASQPAKALVEMMTNQVDAVLLKDIYVSGIDPKGSNAPPNMYAAVKNIFPSLREGRLSNATNDQQAELDEFAEKNLIIANTGKNGTGAAATQCLTFVDNGEGQHPENFPDTFLSIGKQFKSDIPFVQGQYNMGSTGVMRCCDYKLIISRRFDGTGNWGWTLVRVRWLKDGSGQESQPVMEYFVLGGKGGNIPSFPHDCPMLPVQEQIKNKNPVPEISIETGTIIKLYDYRIGKTYTFGMMRDYLNENLIETVLPFKLYDCDAGEQTKGQALRVRSGIDERKYYGLEFAMCSTRASLDSEPQILAIRDDPELGKITLKYIRIGNDGPGWFVGSKERIFYCRNGQVQFKEGRRTLQATCKLPALQNRIAVIVDATEMFPKAHASVWQGDRERIMEGGLGDKLKKIVHDTIKESDDLQRFQEDVRRELLNRTIDAGEIDLIQELFDQDKTLEFLLTGERPVINITGGSGGSTPTPGTFHGNYDLTILEHYDKKIVKNGRDVPENSYGKIIFRTDAADDWINRGSLDVLLDDPNDIGKLSTTVTLRGGRVFLKVEPTKGFAAVGDRIKMKMVASVNGKQDVESEEFEIIITKKAPKNNAASGNSNTPRPGGQDGKDTNDAMKGMPQFEIFTNDGREVWDGMTTGKYEDGAMNGIPMTEDDGGYAVDGTAIYINFDNPFHRNKYDKCKTDAEKSIVSKKYVYSMLFNIMALESEIKRLGENVPEDIDGLRRAFGKACAAASLIVTDSLPKAIDEKLAEQNDDA